MQILRATNPDTIDMLVEQGVFIKDPTVLDQEFFINQIKHEMTHNPQLVLLLVLLEGDKIHGYILVTAPPSTPYAWVLHTYSSENLTGTKWPVLAFYKVITWAQFMGKQTLRMETERNPDAWCRKWGFVQTSAVLSLTIPADPEDLLVEMMSHVKRTQRIVSKQPLVLAEEGDESSGSVTCRQDEPGRQADSTASQGRGRHEQGDDPELGSAETDAT